MTIHSDSMKAAYEGVRQFMKDAIPRLTPGSRQMFISMYSPGFPNKPIEAIVDSMPDEKIDWACAQIEQTLAKQEPKSTHERNLYRIQSEGRSIYVVAANWSIAMQRWKQLIAAEKQIAVGPVAEYYNIERVCDDRDLIADVVCLTEDKS
jgi:hypothetical protein